jgi:uncharacterized protein YegP (UPF0339 family)
VVHLKNGLRRRRLQGASPDMEGLMAYYVYRDSQGLYRWRLLAGNNRTIADSGESYHNRQDCLAAIQLVKSSSAAPVQQ